MAFGLLGRYAGQFERSVFPRGNVGDLSAADCANRDSGCVAAWSGLAGDLLHGAGMEGTRLRRRLHSGSGPALAREHGEHKIVADSERVERKVRRVSKENRISIYSAAIGIQQN